MPADENINGAYPRRWWALAAICVPLIAISIDGTILNVALPTISNALDTTSSQLIWINSAYIILFGSTILLGGSLGDRYGRKWMLEAGLVVFLCGSMWAGLSPGPYSLIIARGFMGIGGGMIMPATLSIITNIFPSDERPKAIGVWAGMAGIGVAIGPLAGGVILTYLSWGWVFFVNVPIVAIGVASIWVLVPDSRRLDAPPVDIRGATLSFLGLMALFYGLIQGPAKGWLSPAVLVAFCLSAVLLGVFIYLESRMEEPLLNVRFFKIPEFTSGVISIAIGFFALYGLLYVLTIYIQSVLAYSPLQAGVALLPFAIVLLVGSPLVPDIVNRLGRRTVVAGGLVVTGAGMLVFTMVRTTTSYSLILAGMFLVSAGMTLAQVPSSDAIMGSIPREKAGEGSATNAAIRQIGSSLGIALIGGISQLGYQSSLVKTAAYQALSGSSAQAAKASINGALEVSSKMGDSGVPLAEAAKSAFVRGLDVSMLLTAAIALAGAVIAVILIPGKKGKRAE